MKILIDASLCLKSSQEYKVIPLNLINSKGVSFLTNEDDNFYNELLEKYRQLDFVKTSFLNPVLTKEMFDISPKENTIIFTVPKSLSSQHEVYKSFFANDNNVLILEGTCLYTNLDEVLKFLKTTKSFKEIKSFIKQKNEGIVFNGFILDFAKLPSSGRVSNVLGKVFKFLNMKVWLEFKNGQWRKKAISKNIWKFINPLVINRENVSLITANIENENVKKYINKITEFYPQTKIKIIKPTIGMFVHSGENFLVLF